MPSSPILAIVGPTACGKTSRAVSLAKALNGEILSADSRQVYTGMDIGTGKDLEEYAPIGLDRVHLIDIIPAGHKYNLHQYLRDYHEAETTVRKNNRLPILCGGTGMYAESVLSGISLPEVPTNPQLREKLQELSLHQLTEILASLKRLHNTTDTDTIPRAIRAIEIEQYYREHPQQSIAADRTKAQRPPSVIILLDIPREQRRKRITQRLHQRIEQGMIHEVQNLLESGIPAETLIYYGLEYKYLTLHLLGRLTKDEMLRQLEIAIHQFAKRQMTWFRGMEKRGFTLHKLPYDLPEPTFLQQTKEILRKCKCAI